MTNVPVTDADVRLWSECVKRGENEAQAIARARAEGREAFARECEAVCPPAGLYTPGELSAYEAAVQDCAAAIRARGERFPLSGADAPSEGGKA